ncbi:hypothetical protein J4G33_04430 [Actinotalea sp. BY-33]|uniref:Uncharacterized protein n=1 Tax=Actinotalea soli TaxID=2819234 RepID=A0A939RTF2_9CELL|nr:hypothetical protein [Actinotalea soli]MBO1751044.1 hypothetical protein [Actinotalea soli]
MRGRTRAARGLAAAGFSTFVAWASHLLAGGAPPGLAGVLVPVVFASAVCVVLAGRRLSLPRLALSVAASQLLFHTLFVLGSTTAGSTTAGSATGHGHHGLLTDGSTSLSGSALLGGGAVADGSTLTSGAVLVHGPLTMWLAHLLAAVVTVAALHRGERALVGLVALGRRVVRAVTPARELLAHRPAADPRRAVLPVVGQGREHLHLLHLAAAVARRGPPRLA